ncbi:hypothetical protein L596_016370 [Steinernema carpocapsae]|uniref:Acyl-CoA thioesterase II domain-containing protein n=1 Tax=Steinernema carpocapsae TaxID=34508 RepID=A0A4U5NIQ9_STECR|nr:hypothetical protein L596_016370 [Steinernema carpocapsae]
MMSISRPQAALETAFVPSKIDRNVVTFSGPHFEGPAVPGRAYGGNTAAQVCNAVRSLYKPFVVKTVKINFLGPGSPNDPTDYVVESYPDSDVLNIRGYQKGRFFVVGKATVCNFSDLLSTSTYPMPNVLAPLDNPSLKFCMATTADPSPWNVFKVLSEANWFEVRPVNFDQIVTKISSNKSQFYWARISKDFSDRDKDRIDGWTVIMFLSDFLIGCPGLVHRALHGAHTQFDGGASLTHNVTFHTHLIDEEGWFLYETYSETQGCNRYLIYARIYSEDGRLVATVVQEAYSPSSKL